MADVLVVDDEDVVRDLIVEILHRAGINAAGVASADAALRYLSGEEVGLVLTDVVMPHRSGLELLSDLRRTRPGVPVIVCSGAATPETTDQAHALGASAVLAKPFTHQELIDAVRSTLNAHTEAQPMARTTAGPGVTDEATFEAWRAEMLGERHLAR